MITLDQIANVCLPGNLKTEYKSLPENNLKTLIYYNLAADTINKDYALDMVDILYSHSTGMMHSELPKRLIPYRVVLDIFAQNCSDEKAHLYIKAVRRALSTKRSPNAFRLSLCGKANQYRLNVPKQLWANWTEESFSRICKIRLSPVLYAEISDRAYNQHITVSDWIRDSIYLKIIKEDISNGQT